MKSYKNWLRYWKNSLADTQRLPLELDQANSLVLPFSFTYLMEGRIPASSVESLFLVEEQKLNKNNGASTPLDPRWQSVTTLSIHIALFTLNPKPEYLQFTRGKKPLYPFWIPVMLNRDGTLQIHADFFPHICREFLEPLTSDAQSFIFSSVDLVDKAAALQLAKFVDWQAYFGYVKEVFTLISGVDLESYQEAHYLVKVELTLVVQDEIKGASTGIIALFEHLLNAPDLPALLKHFISQERPETNPPFGVDRYLDFHFKHLGQMNSSFSLSISQRKSLYNFMDSPDGTVFAVNGPPGTGKTTLLQSVVADAVVRAAIDGQDPTIILACSANNQAVTNINESFSKAESNLPALEGRWLPGFKGYATYLPSTAKEDIHSINYQKLNGNGTFDALEKPEYILEANTYYLDKANAYLGKYCPTIDEVVCALRQQIKDIESDLKQASCLWKNLLAKEQSLLPLVDSACLEDIPHDSGLFWLQFERHLETMERQVLRYFKEEPWLRKVLSLLRFPAYIKERKLALKALFRGALMDIQNVDLSSKIRLLEFFSTQIEAVSEFNHMRAKWEKWKKNNHIQSDPLETEEAMWEVEYLKTKDKTATHAYFYDELDVKHRHQAFQLAIHYWEGRWLQTMHERRGKQFSKSEKDRKLLWKIRAMLTPCFVSTFFMAPKFFSYSLNIGTHDDPIWKQPPLLDFIDLLIVDEAGQVTPEVGIAIFSLAKKAMVVGDVKQIEPVWNILPKIDVGNLSKFGLLQTERNDEISSLIDNGFLASSGSIMKMAQHACGFIDPQNKLKERGMMLVEHRRCNDEIIQYCNDLAYMNMLRPMKGKAKSCQLFPSMLLSHVEGKPRSVNKERVNEEEAAFIVTWLIENKNLIESHYAKAKPVRIEDLVGVITPFRAQKILISNRLREAGFDTSSMKIGTVHALQGAEREIIIFSTVYGKGQVGTMFFDRENKPNMLNVAVSRAKETFMVVGNAYIFNAQTQTPSGLLDKYLQKQIPSGQIQ